MKLLHLTFPYQHTEAVERILRRNSIDQYVIYPLMAGRDGEGKHDGSQAFPGNLTVIQAQVEDAVLEDLLCALRRFREEKRKHQLLQALVLPVEKILS